MVKKEKPNPVSNRDDKAVEEKEIPIIKKDVVIPKKNLTSKIKVEAESTPSKSTPFKLMNIMNQQNQASTSVSESNEVKKPSKKEPTNTTKPEEKKLPAWLFEYPTFDHQMEGDIDRWLSMNFLSQAVRFFPHEKNIDYLSVARALEDAIFTHLGKNCEAYWDRVHDVCGALVGNKTDGHKHESKMGHLARKIIAGEFKTPLDVIKIPKKVLLQSYEGHWIA